MPRLRLVPILGGALSFCLLAATHASTLPWLQHRAYITVWQLVSFTRLGGHSLLDTFINLGLLQILFSPTPHPSYSSLINTSQITKAPHFRHNLDISRLLKRYSKFNSKMAVGLLYRWEVSRSSLRPQRPRMFVSDVPR